MASDFKRFLHEVQLLSYFDKYLLTNSTLQDILYSSSSIGGCFMEQKTLSKWISAALFGAAFVGFFIFFVIVPMYGISLRTLYPEFSNRFWPWLIFLWIFTIPCYAAIVVGLKISRRIGLDQSFSMENAESLKVISYLAAGDTVFFTLGNGALLLMNMSHPGIALASLIISFIGFAVTIAAAALSHLVKKAAIMKEENDFTI